MGLDMWMYGIKKVNEDDVPDNMAEIWYENEGYNVIQVEENDDEFDKMCHDLFEYAVVRNVEYTETDFNKIKREYGIPEEAYLYFIRGDGTKMGFQYGEHGRIHKEIDIPENKVDDYDKKVFRKSLIYQCDELAYWRKEYDLQDLIYNNYKGRVYNCGFHVLDDDLMKKINRYLKSRDMDRQNINDIEYDAKMYHEWY